MNVKAAKAMGEAFGGKPVMTGPFMTETHSPGLETVVVRNPNYWGAPPRLARVVHTLIADGNGRVLALQAGDVDVARAVAPSSATVLRSDPRFVVKEVVSLGVTLVNINQRREPGRDLRVRQAMAYALDRESMVKSALDGGAQAATGPFPPVALVCSDIKGSSYNPAEAKRLLAAAGYRDSDGDGVVEKDGKPLQVTLVTFRSSPEFAMMAEIMQAQLKAVGIRVDIRLVDSVPSLNALMDAGDFDLGLSGLTTVPYGDPHFFLNIMFRSTGAWNRGQVRQRAGGRARRPGRLDRGPGAPCPARLRRLQGRDRGGGLPLDGLPEELRRHVEERRRLRAAPGRLVLPGQQHRQAVVGAAGAAGGHGPAVFHRSLRPATPSRRSARAPARLAGPPELRRSRPAASASRGIFVPRIRSGRSPAISSTGSPPAVLMSAGRSAPNRGLAHGSIPSGCVATDASPTGSIPGARAKSPSVQDRATTRAAGRARWRARDLPGRA